MQGRSLVPLLKGARPAWRNSFLVEYYSDKVFPRVLHMGYKSVRNERWKYIHYLELAGMDELYDLKTDPYEMKNLIHQPGAEKALAEMKKEMERLLQETSANSKNVIAEKIIGHEETGVRRGSHSKSPPVSSRHSNPLKTTR
jgi:arylsulfatase A-like enzyme